VRMSTSAWRWGPSDIRACKSESPGRTTMTQTYGGPRLVLRRFGRRKSHGFCTRVDHHDLRTKTVRYAPPVSGAERNDRSNDPVSVMNFRRGQMRASLLP